MNLYMTRGHIISRSLIYMGAIVKYGPSGMKANK